MKSNKHIFEEEIENSILPENSPLFMPDLTNTNESIYQTVRGTVCTDVIQNNVADYIELIQEKSKNIKNLDQIPPKFTFIISNTVLYIQATINNIKNIINTLLSTFTLHYEYKSRYSWVVTYSELQEHVSLSLNIYSTKIRDIFLFEFQYEEGDKVLYSELFNSLCQKASKMNILCDENGIQLKIEEKESYILKREKNENPKLLNENIKRYLTILHSPYYETVKEELKSLIFMCNSHENRILLSSSGIIDKIVMLKGKDKEIDGLVKVIEDLVNSSCIEI